MAKTLKNLLTSQLQKELSGTNGCLVLDPGPMTVESAMAFRKELREKAGGARLRVIQNRTARHALEGAWLKGPSEPLRKLLRGSTAIVFGGAGPVPIAKVVVEWRKKAKTVLVKGAVADGEVLAGKDAEHLATLPGLHELRGMLVGLIAGGPRGLAATVNGVLSGLVRVLKAHVDKLPADGAPAASETPPGGAPRLIPRTLDESKQGA
jgi:large subunit ribosomal protein L10